MKDVVVIGAGFGGLVSSLLLSRAGLNVILLEREDGLAPLLRNYVCRDFEVNNGFHYLGGYYPEGALRRMFGELGLLERLHPVPVNEEGFDCFLGIKPEPIIVPVGLERVRSVLEKAFPGNERVLAEYFEEMEIAFRDFDFLNLEDYFFRADPKLTTRSLFRFLDERGADAALIQFLSIYSDMLLGVTAKEVSLLTHLLGIGAYFVSAHTFEGGGGALAQALEDRGRECGVRVLTGCEALKIESESRRSFSGVRVRLRKDGREDLIRGEACISTIHPKRLLGLLPQGPPFGLFARRVAGYADTRAVCVFHLAVDREAAGPFVRNYHVSSRNGSGELRHLITLLPDFTRPSSPSNPEVRMSALISAWDNDPVRGCPERKDPSCFEKQAAGAEGGEEHEPSYLASLTELAVRRLEEAFPDLKGAFRIIGTLSPCHLDRLSATWNGSIYGLKCSLDRIGLTPMGPMRGLFLAGQSIVAPGIFGTLVSACLASQRVLRRIRE